LTLWNGRKPGVEDRRPLQGKAGTEKLAHTYGSQRKTLRKLPPIINNFEVLGVKEKKERDEVEKMSPFPSDFSR